MAIINVTRERTIPLPAGAGGEYELFTSDYVDSNIGGLTCRDEVKSILINLQNSTIRVVAKKRITKLDGSYIFEDVTYVLKDTPGKESVTIQWDEENEVQVGSEVITPITPVDTPIQDWIASPLWAGITGSVIGRLEGSRV